MTTITLGEGDEALYDVPILGPIAQAVDSYNQWVRRYNREKYRKARIRLLYIEFDPAEEPPALPDPGECNDG